MSYYKQKGWQSYIHAPFRHPAIQRFQETYKAAQFYGLFVGSADGKLTSVTKITATEAVGRQELQLHQVASVGTKIWMMIFFGFWWMVEWLNLIFLFFFGGEWPWVNPTHFLQYRSDVPRSNLKNFKVTRVHNWNQKQCMGFHEEMPLVLTQRIHGIFTYMNGWFYMKCRQIYHTWILWVMQLQHLIFGFNSFSRSQLHGSCFYRSRLESMTWLCSSLTTWREWPR